ncbi:relaxase/mobilization nuclease domain-containing protein [Moritella viscosa]|uniref:relaxase/mobilization nuclease domain-containing protein n=1 Tax=Moritella viscosa TaxID=80854 RepID=UPI0009246249|nr:hypothetical protein [Moritella viscosa]SHO07935.1 Hydrolase, HAD superfamily, Cof family [Moritella viscosa]SHO16186.1 Hydrolase, HAD superfamily, Cof family [Moritella viscosa]
MAVFRSIHNGKTLRNLRNIIRYCSVDKKGLNNKNNPRLIDVYSNIGDCENVLNIPEYQALMDDFVLTIEANSKLSTNKKQKYIYEHSTISFEMNDDEKLGMKKATELALQIAKKANPSNAPQMLWPQIDSGKLHFHLVRGLHDENGKYQKKSNDFHTMNNFLQKFEKKHNLALTGKNNPDNWINKKVDGKYKRVYFPQGSNENSKASKNKDIDYKAKIDDKGNIKYFQSLKKKINNGRRQEKALIKEKNNIHIFRINSVSQLKSSISNLEQPVNYSFWQKHITNFSKNDIFERNEKVRVKKDQVVKVNKTADRKENNVYKEQVRAEDSLNSNINKAKKVVEEIKKDKEQIGENIKNDKAYNDFRDLINKAYRSSKTAEMFLKTLNDNDIEACITYRKNSGGISFNSLNSDTSMAGGKVNSFLTFGKIKKNDPELFALLTGESSFGEIILTNENQLNNDINIQEINKNYKQKINNDGSTSIFYNKKDSEKYPHNHNLKINAEKNKISFGQSSNDHDLKLAYSLAKQNSWNNATSDNKELIQRSMSIAYAENKDDLFFFKTNEPTLKFEELKEIIGNDLLSKDNLIKLYDNNLVVESDKKEVLVFIKNQLKEHKEDITTINSMLADNYSLKECIEKNEKIEKQKEEQKTINEQKLKVVDKRSNLKNDQISEPKPKRAKSSRNRI